MFDDLSIRWLAGQAFGLIALALCVAGFASKRDDRLFFLLLFANVAFALQFVMFRSWVAAAIAALIVLRIHLVRRYKGNESPRKSRRLLGLSHAALADSASVS